MKRQQQAFAVVRVDAYLPVDCAWQNKITVKEIVPTQEKAEAEVARLTRLNADKGCIYFWMYTRMIGFEVETRADHLAAGHGAQARRTSGGVLSGQGSVQMQ